MGLLGPGRKGGINGSVTNKCDDWWGMIIQSSLCKHGRINIRGMLFQQNCMQLCPCTMWVMICDRAVPYSGTNFSRARLWYFLPTVED